MRLVLAATRTGSKRFVGREPAFVMLLVVLQRIKVELDEYCVKDLVPFMRAVAHGLLLQEW